MEVVRILNDAAQLVPTDETEQKTLEGSLLNTTVMILEIESNEGGAKNPE